MVRTSYRTVTKTTENIYKEKGSKFIAIAIPVTSEENVKVHQKALRKQYYDAQHHCYAYVLGENYSKFRVSDDGEPNHTAGDPILGQIRSKDLTNILVVVVRYFGGIKLGRSGLINAYKIATEAVLNKNKMLYLEIVDIVQVGFAYGTSSKMMRLVKSLDLTIAFQKYEETCTITVKVQKDKTKMFLEKLQVLKDIENNFEFEVV